MHPPQHAAVFCLEEKAAIQTLDREYAALPLSPERSEQHVFEYCCHGTLSLYAAFKTKASEALGKTAARYTPAELVAFLNDIIANQRGGKEIHTIVSLSAHAAATRVQSVW